MKLSNDPDYEAKKNRVLELYDIAEGRPNGNGGIQRWCSPWTSSARSTCCPARASSGRRSLVATLRVDPASPRRRRRRATYKRTKGVRHLLAALDMNQDKLYGHIKTNKNRTTFLAFCRYLRSLYPPQVRIAIVLDNFSPHLSTRKDQRVGQWAAANNVELAYVPTNASFLNRIECHFRALRYFALDGTDHRSHETNSMIRRYIIWRNRHTETRHFVPFHCAQRLPDAALDIGCSLAGPTSVPRRRPGPPVDVGRAGVDHAAGAKNQLCVLQMLGWGQSCWGGRPQ